MVTLFFFKKVSRSKIKKKRKGFEKGISRRANENAKIDMDSSKGFEILGTENKQSKRLVGQYDQNKCLFTTKANSTGLSDIEALRRERDELKDMLNLCEKEKEALKLELKNLKNEACLAEDKFKHKINLLEEQIDYVTKQHEIELQEKSKVQLNQMFEEIDLMNNKEEFFDLQTGKRKLENEDKSKVDEQKITERVRQLENELIDKEKAVWNLSEKLLESIAKNDNFENEIRTLKKKLEELVSSQKKNKKSEVLKQHTKNLTKVDDVSEKCFNDENQQKEMCTKIINLEKVNMRLKKKIFCLNYKMEILKKDAEKFKEDVSRLEAEKESFLLNEKKGLNVSEKVSLPLFTGEITEIDRMKIEVQLKEMALRKVCIENGKLLHNFQNKMSKHIPQAIEKNEETNNLMDELMLTKQELLKFKNENIKLQNNLEEIRCDDIILRENIKETSNILKEIQNRKVSISNKYKEQIDVYVQLLGEAYNEVERLQNELHQEKQKHAQMVNDLKSEMIELQLSKVKNLSMKKNFLRICDEEKNKNESALEKKKTNESVCYPVNDISLNNSTNNEGEKCMYPFTLINYDKNQKNNELDKNINQICEEGDANVDLVSLPPSYPMLSYYPTSYYYPVIYSNSSYSTPNDETRFYYMNNRHTISLVDQHQFNSRPLADREYFVQNEKSTNCLNMSNVFKFLPSLCALHPF